MTMSVTNNPNGPATASTSTAINGSGTQHQHSREASNETTSSGSTVPPVPRVGGVRCYWALLRPSFPSAADPNSKFELTFVHFDPVLSVHLRRERLSMLGRGVIEFIHPNEREQARKDLAGAIAVDDLQGSVTRVRYARLSRIRSLLGCPPEDIDVPAEMERIAEDQDFLILDLVLNWAADGLLLGFFHAIRDVDSRMNNDPAAKHLAWSNWCGTEHMPEDQIEAIAENITTALKPPRRDRNPPSRVFQIHTTDAAPTRPSSTVFSWPPSRPDTENLDAALPLHDGLYDAEEYKYLMKGVDMDPSSMTAPEDTRTNCTTRFGAKHSLNSEGVFRQINSVFIPYGSLIFACFQTIQTIERGVEEPEATNPFSLPGGYDYAAPNGMAAPVPGPPMPETQWGQPMPFEGFPPKPMMNSGQTSLGKRPREDAAVSDWRPPPPPPPPPAMTSHHFPPLQGFPPQPTHPEAGPSRFVRNGAPPHPHVYPPPQEYMQPEPPYPYNPQYMPASGYQAVSHARGTSPGERDVVPLETRLFSGQSAPYPTPAPTMSSITPSSGGSHHHYSGGPVMAPHPRDDLTSPTGPAAVPSSSEKTSSSRPLVKPPGGVSCCRACGTTESPEWRKSESGIKDLCNACGLRLARAQAKKEGRQKPRKKKDKTVPTP